jgi:hypothetical protein
VDPYHRVVSRRSPVYEDGRETGLNMDDRRAIGSQRPSSEAAQAFRDAFARAARITIDHSDAHYGIREGGAEAFVEAYRRLGQVEGPARRLRAHLESLSNQQTILLDDEGKALAREVFDGIKEAVTAVVRIHESIAEIFYPELPGTVARVLGADASVAYAAGKVLQEAGEAEDYEYESYEYLLDEDYKDLSQEDYDRVRELLDRRDSPEYSDWRRERAVGKRLRSALKENPTLDVTDLEATFNTTGPMPRVVVQDLDALLLALSDSRAKIAALIRDNWSLRDLLEPGYQRPVEVTMGDRFENIQDTTIVNRSTVENAFNRVAPQVDSELSDALRELADAVQASGSTAAAETYASFTEELERSEPRKSVLRSLWDGLTDALPSVLQMTEVVAKVTSLF